jgi:hypothetical protein
MRILYLVPPSKRPDRIGAYSFIDEEIEALAAAGIDAFVVSTAAPADVLRRGVHLKSLRARTSLGTRVAAAGFLVRHFNRFPPPNHVSPSKTYRAARAEHFAAEIVRREKID